MIDLDKGMRNEMRRAMQMLGWVLIMAGLGVGALLAWVAMRVLG